MSQQNVFADDWRACLREEYKYVVRGGDAQHREDIKLVMLDAGFTEEELAQLYVEATMHVDDVPADFVPDLDALEGQRRADEAAHAADCMCPACRAQRQEKKDF